MKEIVLQFEDVRLEKGAQESVIYDLSRSSYDTLSANTTTFFEGLVGSEPTDEDSLSAGDKERWHQFQHKEWLFTCPSNFVNNFQPLVPEHKTPHALLNAQVYADYCLLHPEVITQLGSLGVRHLQVRIDKDWSSEELKSFFDQLSGSSIDYVELLLDWTDERAIDNLVEVKDQQSRLQVIHVFSSPEEKSFSSKEKDLVLFTHTEGMGSLNSPKIGAPHLFTVNHQTYREAHHRNLFFNQKVAIGPEGEIKNAMTSSRVFGHFPKDDLAAIVRSDDFQTLWYARKDDIAVCCDCPYRYMCTDEREPIKGPEGWHYTSDCVYNPYTGQWADGLAPKQAL